METVTYSITRDDMLNGSAQRDVPFNTPLARAIERQSGYRAAVPVDVPDYGLIYRFSDSRPGRAVAKAILPETARQFMREYDRVRSQGQGSWPAPVSVALEWEDVPESAYDLPRIQSGA